MIAKKIMTMIIILIGVTFLSNNCFSQNQEKINKTPEEIAANKAGKMKKNLGLSDEQYNQVYELVLKKVQQRITSKDYNKNLGKETRKQLKKENKEEFKKQLMGILNEDQIQKLEENMKKKKQGKGIEKNEKQE